MDRRNFISTAAVASTVAVPSLMATNAIAQTRPKAPQFKVVIIGGGMAGATCAKYLRLWGGGNVAVTIVERNTAYVSNILSSLVLTGQKSLTSLTYDYNTLHSAYGITVVKGDVKELSVHGSVVLTNGEVISGDKIVIAAGVEFDCCSWSNQSSYHASLHGKLAHRLQNWQTNLSRCQMVRILLSLSHWHHLDAHLDHTNVPAFWLHGQR